MADDLDLFGHGPAQGNLFGDGDDRLQLPVRRYLPDPEKVRQRLKALSKKRDRLKRCRGRSGTLACGRSCSQHGQLAARRRGRAVALRFAQEMERLKSLKLLAICRFEALGADWDGRLCSRRTLVSIQDLRKAAVARGWVSGPGRG